MKTSECKQYDHPFEDSITAQGGDSNDVDDGHSGGVRHRAQIAEGAVCNGDSHDHP